MSITKILLLLLLSFVNHLNLFAQNRLINEYRYKIVCSEDTLTKCTIDSLENFYLMIYPRQNEYFTDIDTLKKDYISYYNSFFTFDNLLKLKQRDYTVSVNIENVYGIKTKKCKFLVVEGFNSFQIGSDQQTFFLVFKIFDKRIEVVSSYIIDSSEGSNKIRLIKRRSSIKLKHKKLLLIK